VKVFKDERFFDVVVDDLEPVAAEVSRHFSVRGFECQSMQVENGDWQVAVTKGGTFRLVAGHRTALKIDLVRRANGVLAQAGAGVIRRQAVPGAIVGYFAPPLALIHVWGLIRQAGLDNEALRVIEVTLERIRRLGPAAFEDDAAATGAADGAEAFIRHSATGGGRTTPSSAAPPSDGYCKSCGTGLVAAARFCGACGTPRTERTG
jgi:hypothetical protein